MRELEYSEPQWDIMESTAQRNLMLCGVGTGKSHVAGFIAWDYCKNNQNVRGFIGANTYGQLTKSTLDRIFKVWESYNCIKGRDYVVDHIPPDNFKIHGPALKSYENTISWKNGAMIFTGSMENYKVIDGTEFGWAILDETKDTKEEAVKEVIMARLRQVGMWISPSGVISRSMKPGYTGFNPLYIFTSPAKTRWLMEWFRLDDDATEIQRVVQNGKTEYYRKRKGEQLVVIASTYHNEKNLSAGYIERYINDLGGNPGLVDMLIFGSPFGKQGSEFYTGYNRMKHVKPFELWKDLPVHVSFDFNVVPYISALLFQVRYIPETKRYLLRFFDEFALPNPKNNAESLSLEIRHKYHNLLKNGLFYYGDYSGKNGNTMTKEFRNHYEVIESVLKQYLVNESDRVIVNPLHIKRRNFANKMLSGGFNIDIEIHPQCREMVADFEFVKEDENGGKMKQRIKKDGISYEEHGHMSDCFDYGICSLFDNLFNS